MDSKENKNNSKEKKNVDGTHSPEFVSGEVPDGVDFFLCLDGLFA
jgi:hypothetical protein